MDPIISILVIIFTIAIILGAIFYTIWSWRKQNKPDQKEKPQNLELSRHQKNPVITPHTDPKEWEVAGTFNPAAMIDKEVN